MKRLGIFLSMLFISGVFFTISGPQPASAAVGTGAMVIASANQGQAQFAKDQNRQITAAQDQAADKDQKNVAGGNKNDKKPIRIENIRKKVNLNAGGFGNNAADDKKAAKKANAVGEDNAAAGDAKAQREKFQFNGMIGNDQAFGALHGVAPSETPMAVKAGNAALDANNNFKLGVKGLQSLNGQSVAGQEFRAGVACMNQGVVMAKHEDDDDNDNEGTGKFEVDENGDGEFTGKMDFANVPCVAPIPVVMDANNNFVAVAGQQMLQNDDDFDDDQDDDDMKSNRGKN